MLKLCPDPVDVTDLQFKLQSKLKVFHNEDLSQFPQACSLLACASRYGLVFVGTNSAHLLVIQSGAFQQCSLAAAGKATDSTDFPRQKVELPGAAHHISVNCDCTILAVVVEKDQCPTVIFFEVLSFLRKELKVLKELRLSMTPGVFVREVNWNPSIPGVFTACKSDGSLGVYELNGDAVSINELPAVASACCFCWSPKGKQIAVGSPDGKITQYKPDLKAVKVTNGPKIERLSSMLSLQWVSNYQFIAVYLAGQDEASLVVVDAPKTGEPIFTDYSDVCYSQAQRSPQFFLLLQQTWNVLLVASANSPEIGVLAKDGEVWTQWSMVDTARAELPLGARKENTLPVGFAWDTSSTTPLPMGEGTIPPCPYLCILSHQGVLCCFNAINTKPGLPQLCAPPDPVADTSGLNKFLTPSVSTPQVSAPQALAPQASAPTVSFGIDQIIGQSLQVQSTPIVKKGVNLPVGALFGGQTVTPIKAAPAPKALFASTAPLPVKVKPIVVSAEQKVTNEALMAEMMREEWGILESELRLASERSRGVKVSVGSDNEMLLMSQQLRSLEEFVQVLETVNGDQSAEIQCLKQNTIQTWARFEEAKSCYHFSRSEAVALLIKAQPLDSLSQKRLKDIEQLAYYIESQLSQANQSLDEQWDNFQDYARKTYRVKMPTMEAIFQTMVQQNGVLQKLGFVLKDIQLQTRRKCAMALLLKLDAESGLADDFAALHLTPQRVLKLQHEKIRQHAQHLTAGKCSKLRQLLNRRELTQVKAVKPQVSSWAIQTPAHKLRHSISQLQSCKDLADEPTATPRTVLFPFTEGSAFTRIGTSGQGKTSSGSATFTTAQPASAAATTPQNAFQQFDAKSLSSFPAPAATATSSASASTAKAPALTFSPSPVSSSAGAATFGQNAGPASIASVFGKSTAPSISSSASTESVFGKSTAPTLSPAASAASLFSKDLQSATTFSPAAAAASVFGQNTAPASSSSVSSPASTASVFGKTAAPTLSSAASAASVFGQNTAPPLISSVSSNESVFGKNTAPTFSPAASTASVFAKNTATVFSPSVSSSESVVGKTTAPTFSPANLFGKNTAPAFSSSVSSTESVFGQNTATTFSPAVSSSAASTESVFGKNTAPSFSPAASAASVFPKNTTTTFSPAVSSTEGVFGKNTAPSFTPAASAASVFGKNTTTTFSPAVSSSAASTESVFGKNTATSFSPAASAASVFAKNTTTTFSPAVSSTEGVFGKNTAPSFTPAASAASVFGKNTATTLSPSISSSPDATESVFGKNAAPTLSPSASSSASVLEKNTAPTVSSSPAPTSSVFGKSAAVAAATSPGGNGSIFASSTTAATASTGKDAAVAPASPPGGVFASSPTVSSPSVFGGASLFAAGSASPFGSSPAAAPAFGAAASPTTVFGASAATSSSGSLFATPASAVFGAGTTTAFGAPSGASAAVFGSAASASSVFGASAATTSSSAASVFGAAAAASPVFGAATSTSSAFGAPGGPLFGKPSSVSGGSIFGAPSTSSAAFGSAGSGFGASSGGSLFGATTSAPSGSIFGAAPATSSSGFGAATNPKASSGSFGFGGLSVGAPASPSSNIFAASSGSGFGQTAPAAKNIFGSPTTTASAVFGANTGATFGSSSSGGSFGGSTAFGASTFGAKPAFGQTTAFGASSSFGAPPTGAFSGPTGSPVAQTGFGSSASFQKPSGFGSPPVFGGPPAAAAFGSPPSFGSSPAFGAAPSFGTPEKVFGGAPPPATGGFAAATPENTGFGNLASQNTIGFGNLAQQAATPPAAPFSGFSSFSSWR